MSLFLKNVFRFFTNEMEYESGKGQVSLYFDTKMPGT